jgi:hypothetical protein
MNKRFAIALAVAVAAVWLLVYFFHKPAPAITKAPVAVEQTKVEAPYTVTKTAAPAPVCKIDPRIVPKKLQPKAQIVVKAPINIAPKPTAKYRGVGEAKLLLPN